MGHPHRVHARGVPAYEVPACEVHACEIHAYEVHAFEVHVYEVQALRYTPSPPRRHYDKQSINRRPPCHDMTFPSHCWELSSSSSSISSISTCRNRAYRYRSRLG